jgi:hypothetical protein
MASICDESVKIPRETAENIFQLLTEMHVEASQRILAIQLNHLEVPPKQDANVERLKKVLLDLNFALDPYR